MTAQELVKLLEGDITFDGLPLFIRDELGGLGEVESIQVLRDGNKPIGIMLRTFCD